MNCRQHTAHVDKSFLRLSVVNNNTACCFTTDTLCSTVHSVCPCQVLISSADIALFNAKPTYIYESNKNLQHSFLQTVSVVSSLLNTQHKLLPCCVYSCTLQGLNFFPHVKGFHLTHPQTLWIPTFCMKLVHTELCIAGVLTGVWSSNRLHSKENTLLPVNRLGK